MSFKKVKVVMLSTNEKANVVLHKDKNTLEYVLNQNSVIGETHYFSCQHLYFLSDEEIKEGDWVLNSWNEIHQITKNDGKQYIKTCKKIIATTDKSLGNHYSGNKDAEKSSLFNLYSLPQPSQSFIEKFVEEYNKGNVITEVMVEYESIGAYANPKYDSDFKLKVSKDNTITIRKVKDSWNREEVIKLLNSFEKLCYLYQANKDWFPAKKTKWIEENL